MKLMFRALALSHTIIRYNNNNFIDNSRDNLITGGERGLKREKKYKLQERATLNSILMIFLMLLTRQDNFIIFLHGMQKK